MIAVALAGGLGNLLFEYAFIYSSHKRLNTNFILLKKGSPILLYKYFILDKNTFYYLDLFFFDYDGFKLIFSHYLRRIFTTLLIKTKLKHTVVVDNRDNPKVALKLINDNTIYEGYFQSEQYFQTHSKEILTLFQIKKKYLKAFDHKFNWLNNKKKVVTIHIRRTDYQSAFGYLNLGSADLTLPMSYYHSVIKKIHNSENFYIFISDDILSIGKEFGYLENKYLSQENEIIDFQLMQNADICVIANSSFSWWAAYLNNKEKIVYCPKYYLGFLTEVEYPNQIYPQNWIQIPVI
ncbi:alpha-1,2-fucosyltransferase [Pedobacter changchengzhani]|uniref:Alpha-1,2-fucosyltransferase n=1 Tax=Pedobacter changchengzhani TaxID=2529274 RepID=A0A4R5MIB3_9SPHI|nr:alpha-1,2-fucosyltransferase [Pedobacter changchengzhani]TDG35298.1 alpha-1,2-fucosyltransferase [Pedobacter changchengzhani]